MQTSIQGVLKKLILENTIWPNYFCKKLFLCPIHMAWSLGKVFGSRRRSIRVGGFIWFLEHLQTTDKNQSRQGPKHWKVFVKPHFIMIYHLKCCAMKIRVWQTYPPYKNLVPEIPKLGAGRNMKTGSRVVFTSSYCFCFCFVLHWTWSTWWSGFVYDVLIDPGF